MVRWKSRYKIGKLFALVFLMGAATGYIVSAVVDAEQRFGWLDLQDSGLVGFALETLDADIVMPEIRSKQGKAKFIEEGESDSVGLGYQIFVTVESLDLTTVPAKYRVEKEIKVGSTAIKQLPIESVVYEVTYTLILKDQDGFSILRTETQPHNLFSGQTNEIQDIVPKRVPRDLAKRTKHIDLEMKFRKCVTCE